MTRIEINFSGVPETELEKPKYIDRGPRWLPGIIAGILILLAGMATILVAAVSDLRSVVDKPWNTAYILFDIPEALPELESYPVLARQVARNESLKEDAALKLLEIAVNWERFEQPVRLSDPELIIALDLPQSTLAPLLASGRLPNPGAPEVLAGSLARDDAFWVDDVQFTVVGRLEDSVSGFLFAYMLPHGADFAELFSSDITTAQGLLVVDGQALVDSDLLPERVRPPMPTEETEPEATEEAAAVDETEEEEEKEAEAPLMLPGYLGGMLLAQPEVTHLSIIGLLLAALGGAIAHFCFFKLLWARRYRPILAILDAISKRPLLFIGMHFLLYGVFFSSMYSSLNNPLISYRITQYIEAVFSHGGLNYIGEAYASGDVSRAAWMTFYNNYIEQTLGLTFLVSLFPIPFGLVKNLLSFSLVGGALAPLWVGASQAYVLHALTMVLELEAYIVACFAITAWPLHLYAGFRRGQGFAHVKSGLLMLFSAAVLTAAMLGIAALYEAFTLIYLMSP